MTLTPDEMALYYRLHWALLAYTNRRLNIFPHVITLDDMLRLSTAEKMEVREACYEHPELLESFIAENPEGLPPHELAIVATWRHRVSGEFYMVRYLKRYAVFLSTTEPQHLYGVLGLTEPLDEMFGGRPLPIYVRAVLLPFKEKIIYDGLLNTYNVYFGGGIRSDVNRTYNRLKRRKGIISNWWGRMESPRCGRAWIGGLPANRLPIGGPWWTRSWRRPTRSAARPPLPKGLQPAFFALPPRWPRRHCTSRRRRRSTSGSYARYEQR